MNPKNTKPYLYSEIVSIEGMTCASCVGRVERALKKVEGVQQANVNLATEQAWVQGNTQINSGDLIQAIKKAGYHAKQVEQNKSEQKDKKATEQQQLKRDLIISLILAAPVFVLEMGSHMIPAFHNWVMHNIGTQPSWLIQCVLTTLVLVFPGRRFYQKRYSGIMALCPRYEFIGGGWYIGGL